MASTGWAPQRLWNLYIGTAIVMVALIGVCVLGLSFGLFDPGGPLASVRVGLFLFTLVFVVSFAALTLYWEKQRGLPLPHPLRISWWRGFPYSGEQRRPKTR